MCVEFVIVVICLFKFKPSDGIEKLDPYSHPRRVWLPCWEFTLNLETSYWPYDWKSMIGFQYLIEMGPDPIRSELTFDPQ